MVNDQFEAWENFLRTGKISDYMHYRQLADPGQEEEYIESGEYPDADAYKSSGHWRPGY